MTALTDGAAAHWFVVPPLDGPITGGTRYNAELIAALRTLDVPTEVMPPALAAQSLQRASVGQVALWVDSLFLEHVVALQRAAAGRARVGLLTHYLPTLVAVGALATRAELDANERAALACADRFVVTGAFMRDKLHELRAGDPERPIWLIEPGSELPARSAVARASNALRALMIANLVPGKNVAPFLAALADALEGSSAFRLKIVGSATLDPLYAAECRELIRRTPALAERVELSGALSCPATLTELAACDVLISASILETFGMALRDARTCGVPILAQAGGNVERLVEASSGGQLVASERELARAALALARDPAELAARRVLADSARLPVRPWLDAARELVAFTRSELA